MQQNGLSNCGRWHYEEHFCELILKWASDLGVDDIFEVFLSLALAGILFS